MKKNSSDTELQKLYEKDLFNRYYLHKNVNLKLAKTYSSQMFLGACVLLVKVILCKFYKKKDCNSKALFFSWGPLHTKRSQDLNEDFELKEYQRFSFSKAQLLFFKGVSIKRILKLFFSLKKSNLIELKNQSLYINDTFQYRFLYTIEFLMIQELLNRSDNVFVAGYNDRISLIISDFCRKNKIHLSMLQHGVLGKKEHWKHLSADRFYYLYPFSKDYIQHQIEIKPTTELIYLPKKASSLQLKSFNKGKYKKSLAYATSPADSIKDIELLNELKSHLVLKEYNLLIYPHPLEDEETYNSIADNESIFVTKERHSNILYLISRYSTLGIEYNEIGIEPVFLNYEKLKIDFLDTNLFTVLKSNPEFARWIEALD